MYKLAKLILCFIPRLKSEANVDQVKLIVKYKLLMDNRKQINPNSSSKESNFTLWLQFLMYCFFGGMGAIIIGMSNVSYTSLFLVYGFLIFLLSINLVSDFSTVILDSRDNTIILPRPVSEKTYLCSRIVHVTVYILGFAISYSCIPFITILIKFNLVAAIIFFINVLLSSVFAVFLTHLLYLGLMKLVSGEKFKDIISYFQIFMTIFLFGGYQFLIQSIHLVKTLNLTTDQWWMYLLPPSWMAGSTEAFISFQFTKDSFVLIALSIIIPLAGLWFVVKILAPGFSHNLTMLDQGELKKVSQKKEKFNLSKLLSVIFTRSSTEALFFQFIWKVAARDRKFKQMIYPMLGSIVVFYGIMLMNQFKYQEEFYENKFYLMFLYFPLFNLFAIIINIKYSDNYKSAWIYKSIPLENPGEIISATFKSITIKLFVPVYLTCNSILIYFGGISFLLEIITALLLSFISLLGVMFLFKFDFPFSADNKNKSSNANMLLAMLIMPLAAVMAGIHYLFIRFHFNFFLVSLVLFIICWFVFKQVRKVGWRKIEAIDV